MILEKEKLKPSLNEWADVAGALATRLSECVHVYKHKTAVFMPQMERQHKMGHAIYLLQELYALLDETEDLDELVANSPDRADQIISSFEMLFAKILRDLPWLSEDMQKLLESPWMKDFTSKQAEDLFFGGGKEHKGLGSGHAEHGRLPHEMEKLMDRERMGDIRQLQLTGNKFLPERNEIEKTLEWAKKNTSLLTLAGRID